MDGIYNGLAGDFDINRVEVLRGPQGTLYGRSATSGVVSVITTDPKLDEFSGDVTTEVGSDQLYHGQGAVNLPIGDNLAVRISAKHFQQDGPVVSSEGYKQKKQTVRAKLLYQLWAGSRAMVFHQVVDRTVTDTGLFAEATYPVAQTDFRVLTSPARMWGLELEANYLVTEDDRIDFAFGHTNAEFVDKPDIPGVNPFASFVAQTKIPIIVPTNVSLGYNHTFNLPNGSILDFYNQLRYAAGYDQAALTAAQLSGGAKPFVHEGNTWQWDARLGWMSPGGKFSTTVYANNLADKVYKQGAALLSPSEPWQSTHATTAPRTIGLVLNVKF